MSAEGVVGLLAWGDVETRLLSHHVQQYGAQQWEAAGRLLARPPRLVELRWHALLLAHQPQTPSRCNKGYSLWELGVLLLGYRCHQEAGVSKKRTYRVLSEWLPGRSAEGVKQALLSHVVGYESQVVARLRAEGLPLALGDMLLEWPGPRPQLCGAAQDKAVAADILAAMSESVALGAPGPPQPATGDHLCSNELSGYGNAAPPRAGGQANPAARGGSSSPPAIGRTGSGATKRPATSQLADAPAAPGGGARPRDSGGVAGRPAKHHHPLSAVPLPGASQLQLQQLLQQQLQQQLLLEHQQQQQLSLLQQQLQMPVLLMLPHGAVQPLLLPVSSAALGSASSSGAMPDLQPATTRRAGEAGPPCDLLAPPQPVGAAAAAAGDALSRGSGSCCNLQLELLLEDLMQEDSCLPMGSLSSAGSGVPTPQGLLHSPAQHEQQHELLALQSAQQPLAQNALFACESVGRLAPLSPCSPMPCAGQVDSQPDLRFAALDTPPLLAARQLHPSGTVAQGEVLFAGSLGNQPLEEPLMLAPPEPQLLPVQQG